jgi:hypothetical protein
MEERRTVPRYNLALEIRFQPELEQFQPISGFTRDISINGFSFGTSQKLSVRARICFSIMLTPFAATTAFISGGARVVWVEQIRCHRTARRWCRQVRQNEYPLTTTEHGHTVGSSFLQGGVCAW